MEEHVFRKWIIIALAACILLSAAVLYVVIQVGAEFTPPPKDVPGKCFMNEDIVTCVFHMPTKITLDNGSS